MSEEEKKAIEKILVETVNNYKEYYKGTEAILPQISEDYKNASIILNYINKLQKENEKLKQDNYNLDRENQLNFEKIIKENENIKDKIRDKIKEFQNKECEDMQTILIKHLIIEMLEELLEE